MNPSLPVLYSLLEIHKTGITIRPVAFRFIDQIAFINICKTLFIKLM